MKRILVTGGEGLLGQHLRFFLQPQVANGEVYIELIGRQEFEDQGILRTKVSECDVLVHLAGMNRGEEHDIYETNMSLIYDLLAACDAASSTPHIIFPSSTHETRDSAYGRSKRDAVSALRAWGKAHNCPVSILVLPHVFGEFAKPFHNSGIATMCHQLAQGEESEVNSVGVLELIHARDVAQNIYRSMIKGVGARTRIRGKLMSVSRAYELLSRFAACYRMGEFPAMSPGIETQLFTTLHSYLAWKVLPHRFIVRSDERGSLFEAVRGAGTHQVFFSRTSPGFIRGNHYHTRKMERFCVISGEAEIRLRRLLTNEVRTFNVSADVPVAIDMPTYWTHSIRNIGSDELLTAFWSSEQYDPGDSDTFPEET